jgi:hypothetical protein
MTGGVSVCSGEAKRQFVHTSAMWALRKASTIMARTELQTITSPNRNPDMLL